MSHSSVPIASFCFQGNTKRESKKREHKKTHRAGGCFYSRRTVKKTLGIFLLKLGIFHRDVCFFDLMEKYFVSEKILPSYRE